MSNRTFAAQPSFVKSSSEEKRQVARQLMATDLSRHLGEAPYDYGSNRIGDYLKLADKDLRDAANQAIHCSRGALLGASTAAAGATALMGSALAFGFNRASVASAITLGLGMAVSTYTEYKSRQLKSGINAQLQHFDKA
jgi:hypothetical protein